MVAYGVIGIVVAQRLESEADCHQLLKLIGLSGALMAAFAVVQLMTSNDRFFWIYRQPYTGTRDILKGAFTNRNHFAQFLALSIGPLMWWMLAGRQTSAAPTVLHRKGLGPAQGNHSRFDNLIEPKLLILLCAVGGVMVCVMLSLSRGGMVAAGIACTVSLAGLWRSGKVRTSLAGIMLALGVSAIGGLIVFGQDRVEDRVSQLASGNADKLDQLNARRLIWKADLAAIKQFPIVGTGVGSHRYIYPMYMEELADFDGVSFTHAESSYIHLGLETGLAGLVLLILGLLFVCGRFIRKLIRVDDAARTAAVSAVVAGLLAGMIHAAADFIWYVPAIVVVTILLVVIGLRLCDATSTPRGIFMPRIAWLAASAGCLLLLFTTQRDLSARVTAERAWYAYLNVQFDHERSVAERKAAKSDPNADEALTGISVTDSESAVSSKGVTDSDVLATYNADSSNRQDDDRVRSLNSRIRLLMESLKAQPDQPQAAMHLAGRCLDLFQILQRRSDNPLDLVNIRDTVMASKFGTTSEMHDWLKRAFGTPIRLVLLADQAARRSLAICPVQPDGYELLLNTGFVRDPGDAQRESILQQAITVGRYSPAVRYSAGFAFLADGKTAEAVEQWTEVFHSTPQMRAAFCRRIGKSTNVDFILQKFDPSPEELQEVLTEYAAFRRVAEIEKIVYVLADKTRPPDIKRSNPAHHNASLTRTETDTVKFADESSSVMANTSPPKGREHLAPLLTSAARTAASFQLLEQSEELLRIAIQCDPDAYWPRHALGTQLFGQQRYREAETLFAWCSEQEPGDTKLEDLRRECRRLAVTNENRLRPASLH